jgi:hypothetical protein
MHGHLEESNEIAHLEGGLRKSEITSQWAEMKERAARILQTGGLHGFVTIQTTIDPNGKGESSVKHSQLISRSREEMKSPDSCLDEIMEMLRRIVWPASKDPSKLVYALCSELLP